MAQSIPDRSIISELALGYLDAYYSTEKHPPLPAENGNVVKKPVEKEEAPESPVKNGSAKKRGVKNGHVKH